MMAALADEAALGCPPLSATASAAWNKVHCKEVTMRTQPQRLSYCGSAVLISSRSCDEIISFASRDYSDPAAMAHLRVHRPTRQSLDRHWRASKHAILAYHAGGWREGESPLDALARALDLPAEDMTTALADPAAARDEAALLASCLDTSALDFPGLTIGDAVARAVTLINEKLARVPPDVRAFFGAPRQLEPIAGARQTTPGPARRPLAKAHALS